MLPHATSVWMVLLMVPKEEKILNKKYMNTTFSVLGQKRSACLLNFKIQQIIGKIKF